MSGPWRQNTGWGLPNCYIPKDAFKELLTAERRPGKVWVSSVSVAPRFSVGRATKNTSGTGLDGQSFIAPRDGFRAFGAYMGMMMKQNAIAALLLLSTPVLAQTLPDPALQRYETQSTVNQQLLQTQQNNLQVQQGLQQNEIRQQQLFNSMPPPAYQQQQAFTPPPVQK
jgi:hypothetical protein